MSDWTGSGTPTSAAEATYITTAQADAYFATRLGAAVHWAVSPAEKLAALITAENVLGELWTLTDTDTARAAICEQALFMLRDPGVEARMNLQAQGVTQAGIVQETYAHAGAKYAGVAPRARKILDGATGIAATGSFAVER